MTGRNPIHVNVVNGQTTLLNPADPVSGYSGIPTNMTSIAEKLVSAGYRAHAVGKVRPKNAGSTCALAGSQLRSFCSCPCPLPCLQSPAAAAR
jgi:hypothetical protein